MPEIGERNIWGRPGCELPTGKLCNACCVFPQIELESGFVSVVKPPNTPCPFLKDTGGCSKHPNLKPWGCKTYHCSSERGLWFDSNGYGRLTLIAQALALGLVTKEEAIRASLQHCLNTNNEISRMLEYSEKLKILTQERGLLTCESEDP